MDSFKEPSLLSASGMTQGKALFARWQYQFNVTFIVDDRTIVRQAKWSRFLDAVYSLRAAVGEAWSTVKVIVGVNYRVDTLLRTLRWDINGLWKVRQTNLLMTEIAPTVLIRCEQEAKLPLG